MTITLALYPTSLVNHRMRMRVTKEKRSGNYILPELFCVKLQKFNTFVRIIILPATTTIFTIVLHSRAIHFLQVIVSMVT